MLDPNGVTFNANSGTFYTIAASSPTAAPQLISYCPGYGVSNVPVNAVISLAYNLPIDGTTLAAGVNFSGGVPASITLASPNVIRIVPTAVMTPNTFYYVCINSTLKGANGTPVATGFYTTYFYTSVSSVPDTTTGVVTVGPPANSVSVGTNAYVRLDFSKLADPTSISSSIVAVTQGGSLIPGTFSYVMSGNTVTGANFSPVNPLPASSVIQIAVNGVADRVGTMFTPVTEHFTTAATPDITGAIPYYEFPGNMQNIDTNAIFTCRYNKPMDPSSFNQGGVNIYNYGNGTKVPLTYGVSTDLMSVTLIPTSPLTLNREYNYECFNALDLTGNAQHGYGGPYFFTGGGTVVVGPMLIASNPANGSTNVALNNFSGPANSTSLILQFNEAPAENSLGNITLTPQGGSPLAIGTGLFNGDTTVVAHCSSAEHHVHIQRLLRDRLLGQPGDRCNQQLYHRFDVRLPATGRRIVLAIERQNWSGSYSDHVDRLQRAYEPSAFRRVTRPAGKPQHSGRGSDDIYLLVGPYDRLPNPNRTSGRSTDLRPEGEHRELVSVRHCRKLPKHLLGGLDVYDELSFRRCNEKWSHLNRDAAIFVPTISASSRIAVDGIQISRRRLHRIRLTPLAR